MLFIVSYIQSQNKFSNSYFILKHGLPRPDQDVITSRPKGNYDEFCNGWVIDPINTNNMTLIESKIGGIKYYDDTKYRIEWYVLKWEDDGWHTDGQNCSCFGYYVNMVFNDIVIWSKRFNCKDLFNIYSENICRGGDNIECLCNMSADVDIDGLEHKKFKQWIPKGSYTEYSNGTFITLDNMTFIAELTDDELCVYPNMCDMIVDDVLNEECLMTERTLMKGVVKNSDKCVDNKICVNSCRDDYFDDDYYVRCVKNRCVLNTDFSEIVPEVSSVVSSDESSSLETSIETTTYESSSLETSIEISSDLSTTTYESSIEISSDLSTTTYESSSDITSESTTNDTTTFETTSESTSDLTTFTYETSLESSSDITDDLTTFASETSLESIIETSDLNKNSSYVDINSNTTNSTSKTKTIVIIIVSTVVGSAGVLGGSILAVKLAKNKCNPSKEDFDKVNFKVITPKVTSNTKSIFRLNDMNSIVL